MTPLVANAADEMRNLDEISEGGRPVGNREPGIVAGDERTESDHDEGSAGDEDGEGMVGAVVGCGNAFQDRMPGSREVRSSVPGRFQTRCICSDQPQYFSRVSAGARRPPR